MKRIVLLTLLAPFLLMNMLGCAPLIIGGAAGALGACAVSKDTIEGDTDKSYDSLWNAVLAVSGMRGTIKYEDGLKGYLEVVAESSKVYIRLIRLTRATTRLRVSARKYHFPNLNLAENIFVKIMEEAK